MNSEQTVAAPIAKAVTMWAAIGITNWSDAQSFAGAIASIFAAMYSLCLLFEWVYKRMKRNAKAKVIHELKDTASGDLF